MRGRRGERSREEGRETDVVRTRRERFPTRFAYARKVHCACAFQGQMSQNQDERQKKSAYERSGISEGAASRAEGKGRARTLVTFDTEADVNVSLQHFNLKGEESTKSAIAAVIITVMPPPPPSLLFHTPLSVRLPHTSDGEDGKDRG